MLPIRLYLLTYLLTISGPSHRYIIYTPRYYRVPRYYFTVRTVREAKRRNKEIEKSQKVIFHQFAQKCPFDALSPILAREVVLAVDLTVSILYRVRVITFPMITRICTVVHYVVIKPFAQYNGIWQIWPNPSVNRKRLKIWRSRLGYIISLLSRVVMQNLTIIG